MPKRRGGLAALSLLLASCAQPPGASPPAAPADTKLVTLSDGGEFVEIERTADLSVVEVRSAPKGSVPSSLYTLRGVCAVLHARHAPYVSSETVSGAALPTYRLRFPATVTAEEMSGRDRHTVSSSDCALLRF